MEYKFEEPDLQGFRGFASRIVVNGTAIIIMAPTMKELRQTYEAVTNRKNFNKALAKKAIIIGSKML